MTDRKTIDQITSDQLDQLHERLNRAEAAIARVRALESGLWQVDDQRDMEVSAVCHSVANDLRAALDEPAPGPDTTAPQATDGTVCDAYRPPATSADSGLCARCGMYDYRHAPPAEQQRDQLAGVLSEILLVFHPVSSHNGVRIGWTAPHPIHPDDMDRWTAALPKEPTP